MELRDLEYFAVVAEQGHLGRAANILRLSQPALSKCLTRLESSLEVKLFRRTPKGMELTAEGSLLLSRMRDLRQSLRNVASEIADLNRGHAGHLRIGVGPAVPDQLVMASICELMREAPRLTTKLVISDADQILPALRKGELDVVINHIRPMDPAGLKWSPLYVDEYVVCCSSSHRLAARNDVPLSELSTERWALSDPSLPTQQRLRDVFQQCGLPPPQVALECRLTGLRLQAAASSDLLLYASRAAATRAVAAGMAIRIVPIAELAWRRSIGVISRDEQYTHPAVARFVEIFERVAADTPRANARDGAQMRSELNAKPTRSRKSSA